MKALVLTLFLFLFVSGLNADKMNHAIDSLKEDVKKYPDNAVSLRKLGENALHLADVELAKECGERLIKLGNMPKKNPSASTWGNMLMGHVSIMEGDPKIGFKYLTQARELAELSADSAALASILNGIAIYTYTYVGDVPGAIDYYHRGLRCAKAAKDDEFYHIILNNIANAHIELGDTVGLDYAREVYDYADTHNGTWLRYASALCIADNYFLRKDYTRSLRFISEAEKSASLLEHYSPFELYHQRGRVLAEVGSDKLAKENFQKAKDLSRHIPYRYMTVMNSDARFEIGRGNYARAKEMLDSVLTMTSDTVDTKCRLEALSLQSRLHELQGDYKKAVQYEHQYDSLKNMTLLLVSTRSKSDAHVRYHFEQLSTKLMQEQINSARTQRKFAISIMSAAILLGGICLMLFLHRKLKKMHTAIVGQMQVSLQTEDMLRRRIRMLEAKSNPPYHPIALLHDKAQDTPPATVIEQGKDSETEPKKEPVAEITTPSNVNMHLEEINEEEEETKENEASSGQKPSQLIVEEIEQLFEQEKSYRDPQLTRDTVSKAIKSNPTYVTRAISDCYKCGFKQFVNNYRIHEAVRILSNPDDDTPIKAIGSMIGFRSPTSFYSHFKEAMGITPAAYRAAVMEKKNEESLSENNEENLPENVTSKD